MQDMRKLGRLGGLRGGPARAERLSPRRKTEIAKSAATARWKFAPLTLRSPNDLGELRCFVAQYGNGHARTDGRCDPTAVLLRTLSACRDDAFLARMLPVFIHRARTELFSDSRLLTVSPRKACALGYFIELTCQLGKIDPPDKLLLALRHKIVGVETPFVLFRKESAPRRESPLARSWKISLTESQDSLGMYFEKAFGTGPQVFRHMPMLGKR